MYKKICKMILIIIVLLNLLASNASAATPYDTYSYSYNGNMLISPAAYTVQYEVSDFGVAGSLKTPEDIIYDSQRRLIIISDTGNNRILILNTDFKLIKEISSFNIKGNKSSFASPRGIFLTDDLYLYVADSGNQRILVFDNNFVLYKELPALSVDILPESFLYKPKAIAVDNAKNVYVVSSNTNMGVIALDQDGSFQGFLGAQRVSINPMEMIWRSFMSEEQLKRTTSYVPVEYSNLTVDKKGFIYVTCSNIDRYDLYTAVQSRSKSATYSPIKKINPSGTDVLRRNGFFPPVGDINFDAYKGSESVEPSQITEVILRQNGIYVLLDSSQNKLFTYDSNGNLLYAFGGTGEVMGLYSHLSGAAYNDEFMYTLDSGDGTITVSVETDYGKLLDKVIYYQENRQYDKARSMWKEISVYNNNYDSAYLGMGRICMENGKYKEAMNYFRLINSKTDYSKAYKFYRQEFLDKWGLAVFVVVIAIVIFIVKIFMKINKINKKCLQSQATGLLRHELLYGFYSIRHPFSGYWGLKNEKRGSIKSATIFWCFTIVSSIVSSLGACYLQKDNAATVTTALSTTVIPMVLWCVSNMCFTSLMDGKGSVKDVYIAVGYSTVPYNLVMIPCTLISYVLVSDELSLLSLVMTVALFWSVILIFLSMMTVHEYSFGKNIVVSILTVCGMAFILFILLIFFNLTGRVQSLIVNMINEIIYRS